MSPLSCSHKFSSAVRGSMIFTSSIFLFLFLPVVLLLHAALPPRWRNSLLFAASVMFYAYGEGMLAWILLFSVAFNYLAGRCLAGDYGWFPRADWMRETLFYAAVLVNLGFLAWFKYANFFVNEILRAPEGHWSTIALPIGISFYTFQGLSYIMDVRNRCQEASRSFLDFGCYITCFPQLIAGPIVRYSDIAHELLQRRVSLEGFALGVERFLAGFCKKMLIANPMGRVSDSIYAMPVQHLDMPHAWLAITCYALQIYYDFSGYSDMAIGLGRMMGFTFPENFNYPYIARSVREFWQRWHMTLSSWLRDYLYIPLGGSRVGAARTVFNLWLVFLLCGLWHGAQWSFLAWGAYHGFFLVLERTSFGRLLKNAPRTVQHGYTLLAVGVGWVIFRADTLPQAGDMLLAAAGLGQAELYALGMTRFFTGDFLLALSCGLLFACPTLGALQRRCGGPGKALDFASLLLLPLFVVALFQMSADTYNPFLYFRF